VRSCVTSTVPESVPTYEFTLPTSVRTYFLVAHAGATATDRVSSAAANRLFRMMVSLL